MGTKCKATKNNGQPCESYALAGGDYCYTHDPGRAGERAAARKLGGLNRQTKHAGDRSSVPSQVRALADVLLVLDYTLAETLALENGITRGRLLVAICSEYTNTIKTGELEDRLAALEAILKSREAK
jgi:hypothetical protein